MQSYVKYVATLFLAAFLAGLATSAAQEDSGAARRITQAQVDRVRRKIKDAIRDPLQWGIVQPELDTILKSEDYRDDVELLYYMGICWLDGPAANLATARSQFEKVVERDQTYAAAYVGLARTWIKGEERDISQAKNYLLEAMQLGYDVLGTIAATADLKATDELSTPEFTEQLLKAQTRFVFENIERTDPFYIPRDLLNPRGDDDEAKNWNRQRQEDFVREMEELWQQALSRIDSPDQAEVEIGLQKYRELVARISASGERITHPEFRFRLAEIEQQMEDKKRIIRLKILEQFAKEGNALLADMSLARSTKDFDKVIEIFETKLVPLTDNMIETDETFMDMANEILGKGQKLNEEAVVGKEIQALQLEVLGIVISEVEEFDVEGKPTGKRAKITIIQNKTEEWTGEEKDKPAEWEPPQRKYFIGDTVQQIEALKIQEIERDKVVCLYKDQYEVDLDLKRQEEVVEEE